MRLRSNPFYLLEVSPEDSIAKINEATENKCFINDENEHLYEDARLILTSPVKRIAAEIRYIYSSIEQEDGMKLLFAEDDVQRNSVEGFLGDSYEEFIYNNRLYSCYEIWIGYTEWLYSINDDEEISEIILNLALENSFLLEPENVKGIARIINSNRKKAGITLLDDNSALMEEIGTLKDDAIDAINDLFTRLDDRTLIETFNLVSQKMVFYSDDIIKEAINIYAVKFKEILGQQKNKILIKIDELREDLTDEGIDELCDNVRWFDYIAQPIQVYLLKSGQSNLQVESPAVALAVRNFAREIFKDKREYKIAKKLLDLGIALFSELPELVEYIKLDKFVVSCLSECIECVEKCERKPENAVAEVYELITIADNNLAEDNVDESIKALISDEFATAMLQCIIKYGNKTHDWGGCIKVMSLIKKYVTSEETKERFDENIRILKENFYHGNVIYKGANKSNSGDNNTLKERCYALLKYVAIVALLGLLYICFFSPDKKTINSHVPVKNVQSSVANDNKNIKEQQSSTPVAKAGIMTGYDNTKEQLAYGGNASVTIDNSQNNMPVYVRIWDTDSNIPVRAFYIAKGGIFTAEKIVEGHYEVRYIELYDNDIATRGSKSERFFLQDDGYSYSEVSITLYKVVNGNMRTSSIDASNV